MPRNKKEKNISQTDDDLLLDLAKNPIFNEMPTKKNKIKIDSRFKKMLTDRRFDERNFLVDKRGKPVIRGKEGNFAKRIYEVSEESECSNSQDDQSNEEEEDEGEGSAKVYREIKNIKRRTAKDGNFDDTVITNEDLESMDEEDNSDDKDSSDCEDLPRISLDLARGEAPDINSSSSEDEEEDLSEHSDEEKSDGPDLESGVRRVEWASSRLAICNVDWSKISAEALMIVIQSLKPSTGVIHSVSVYLSDFGAEQLEYEKLHGPKIVLRPSKRRDKSDLEERTRQAIHAYEVDRLRYYYAVCECDTMETAIGIYEACDGVEYESSGIRFDLRFIPDEMKFEENRLRDRIFYDEINLNKYKPKNVKTHPLQCSNPKLSWEEGDLERKMKMKNAFEAETRLEEFESLVAASSDEDEKTQKNRYQILIAAAKESALERGDMFSIKEFSTKEKELNDNLVSKTDQQDGIVEGDSNEDSDENEELKTGKRKQTKFQLYLERKKKIKAERKKKELEQRKEKKRQNNLENEGENVDNEKTDEDDNWHQVKKDHRFKALFYDSAFAIDKTHSQYKGGDLANRQVYGKISQKRRNVTEFDSDLLPSEDNNSLLERLKKKQKQLQQSEDIDK